MRSLLLVSMLVSTCAAGAERAPTLLAVDLVEPAVLSGPRFRVEPRADLRGLQAHFVIHSEWGDISADSVEMLAIRVSEMPAVQAAYSRTLSNTLNEAGFGVLRSRYRASASLAKHPVQAGRNTAHGVLRYFSEKWNKVAERARKLGYRIDRAIFHDGTPWNAEGPIDDGRPTELPEPWWQKPVDESWRFIRSEAGHGRARREIAAALGVASWTSNPLLRDRIDALAWTVAVGRVSSEAILAMISAGVAQALGQIHTVQRLTLEAEPDDQRREAEHRLERWTTDPNLRFHLTWRGAFPARLLMELVELLDDLAPSGGVEAFLETARMADSELEARFVLNLLRLLNHGPGVNIRGGSFEPIGALVLYRAPDDELLLPLAVDRLSWTADVRRWFSQPAITDAPRRTVLLGGEISPLAERMLTRRGWSILRRVAYAGAPPYRRAL